MIRPLALLWKIFFPFCVWLLIDHVVNTELYSWIDLFVCESGLLKHVLMSRGS